MRYRRITAAIFDILIFLIISYGILILIIPENYLKKIEQYQNLQTEYAKNPSDELNSQISNLVYDVDHSYGYVYLIVALVIIIYFIFIPVYLKNQTFGQHIRKVRLESDKKITVNTYIIRALLNSGITILLLLPILVYILPVKLYSLLGSILCFIQILYWIIAFFMLLLKKKTLHDIITNTKIIEVKR